MAIYVIEIPLKSVLWVEIEVDSEDEARDVCEGLDISIQQTYMNSGIHPEIVNSDYYDDVKTKASILVSDDCLDYDNIIVTNERG